MSPPIPERLPDDPDTTQVSPGVYRLGDHVVNFYLVEYDDGITMIDSGLPGHLDQVHQQLTHLGADLRDIRAVLITHGHPDHTGLAERLRTQAGAEVWVHQHDAATLAEGPRSAMRHAKPERSMLPYLFRHPAAIGTPVHLARKGAFTAPAVQHTHTFAKDTTLTTVPGQPHVITLPGHTPGSAAYLFTDRGLLFTGDALVTFDGLTRHTGPSIACRAFTNDSAAALNSLDRLSGLKASILLPGHGQPFTGDPQAAAEAARRTGPR